MTDDATDREVREAVQEATETNSGDWFYLAFAVIDVLGLILYYISYSGGAL